MLNFKANNKVNDKKLYIFVVLIILITIVAWILNRTNQEETIPQPQSPEEVEEYVHQNLATTLQGKEERERMEYYVGTFIGYIESGEDEKAYELLYEEFKKNYFPTLEDFKSYVPTVFSEMNDIQHKNIERNGDVYILWVGITDAINGKQGEEKQINFVIQEKDYHDFVLSFSVI